VKRNPKKKYNFDYLSVDGRIILNWIVKKQDKILWTGYDRDKQEAA
jgi:hypothetical protein